MRTKICAELGTAHHGALDVALQMIHAAAEAGCDAVKVQHYGAVNPKDPQAQWLNESRLHVDAIETLRADASRRGMEFWATPFDAATLLDLETVAVDRIKIASSESHNDWWHDTEQALVVSWPWGRKISGAEPWPGDVIHLCAIPLYPTPIECVPMVRGVMKDCDGWSDHTVGLSACLLSISSGAKWLEVHLTLPGITRERPFEKEPSEFRRLRQFAEDVETMRTGVGQVFRDRWSA
jgi:sialic acid synthase SpsE